MATRTWRVYGAEGHRQRESFCDSIEFDTWSGEHIEILNSDKTGTNEYSIVRITSNGSERSCEEALNAQISDGIFENCNVGRIEEIQGEF